MQVVASYLNLERAHLALSRLQSAGIEAELRDEATVTLYWLLSPAIGGVKVTVPEADVEAARQILRMPALEAGFVVCPHCGTGDVTVRTLSPTGAVLLATGLPLPLAPQRADCNACGRSFEVKAHPATGADSPERSDAPSGDADHHKNEPR